MLFYDTSRTSDHLECGNRNRSFQCSSHRCLSGNKTGNVPAAPWKPWVFGLGSSGLWRACGLCSLSTLAWFYVLRVAYGYPERVVPHRVLRLWSESHETHPAHGGVRYGVCGALHAPPVCVRLSGDCALFGRISRVCVRCVCVRRYRFVCGLPLASSLCCSLTVNFCHPCVLRIL